MGGNDAENARVMQTVLFVLGLNTLLQSLFGTRLPSVVVTHGVSRAGWQSQYNFFPFRSHGHHLYLQGLMLYFRGICTLSVSMGNPNISCWRSFCNNGSFICFTFESTGTFFATARYGSAIHVPPSVISRGAGWLGIGVLVNGMFDSVTGTCASVENAGIPALTRVGSRRAIQISAGFMILFSVLFDYIVTVIYMSHTTVASLVALILDCSLSRATDATRKDTGLHWWVRFSLYSSYIRNDEFFELPFGLNKLFPAL